MSRKSRIFRGICSGAIGGAFGWTVSAIWFTPPIKDWEGVVVLVLLVIIYILHLVE